MHILPFIKCSTNSILPSETDQSSPLKDIDILVAIKIHRFNHMKEKWAPHQSGVASFAEENPVVYASNLHRNM